MIYLKEKPLSLSDWKIRFKVGLKTFHLCIFVFIPFSI